MVAFNVGTPSVGLVQTISPTGVDGSVAFGVPSVASESLPIDIAATGIDVGFALGGAPLAVPHGFAAAAAFGTPAVVVSPAVSTATSTLGSAHRRMLDMMSDAERRRRWLEECRREEEAAVECPQDDEDDETLHHLLNDDDSTVRAAAHHIHRTALAVHLTNDAHLRTIADSLAQLDRLLNAPLAATRAVITDQLDRARQKAADSYVTKHSAYLSTPHVQVALARLKKAA